MSSTNFTPRTVSHELAGLQSQFDLIKYKSIYALSISLNLGVSDVKVSFEDLGFSEEESQIKKKALLKPPPIVVYPELKQYGHKLSAIKKDLQSRFMISGNRRWWFVLESRIEELCKAIDSELNSAAELFREKVLANYSQARADYRNRVIEAFAGKFSDREYQDEVILRYLSRFPNPQEISERFFVAIDGPLRISSVMEDAEVAEKASILALRRQWQENIMQSLQGSLQEAQDEVFALVADLLGRMEEKPAGDLSPMAKQKFSAIVERLDLLINFNESLEEINQSLDIGKTIQKVTKDYEFTTDESMAKPEMYRSHIAFKIQLNKLRNELKATVDLSSNNEGHRSLAKWLRIS